MMYVLSEANLIVAFTIAPTHDVEVRDRNKFERPKMRMMGG